MNADPSNYDGIFIEKLINGGQGLGRLPDGRALFVPFVLPGEKVSVKVIEERQRYVRAELLDINEPVKERISPLCKHYQVCGGCHFQHIPYETQLLNKKLILEDQLQRIGKLEEIKISPVNPSSLPWKYRNAMQFHIADNGKLGFVGWDSNHVIPIDECHLPLDSMNIIWQSLDLEMIPGLERISIRMDDQDEALLMFESSELNPPEFSVDMPVSAVFLNPADPIVLSGEPFVYLSIQEHSFRVSAESFFQVNSVQASAMIEYLLEAVPFNQEDVCLDIYCGVGLFSCFIAPYVSRCIGIESSLSAVEDFIENLDDFDNVEIYNGAAEVILPDFQIDVDLIILDPPRAGVDKIVIDEICRLQPQTIVYISCDTATLARDLSRILSCGYQIWKIKPFDMFPQTYHLETMTILRR